MARSVVLTYSVAAHITPIKFVPSRYARYWSVDGISVPRRFSCSTLDMSMTNMISSANVSLCSI